MISGSLSRGLKQTVTYWGPSTYNKYGDQTWAAPVTFAARWESRNELFITKDGEESHARAIVYALTSMAVDGYLYLGTSVATDPETVSGADKIRRIDGTPDLKGQTTLYKAYL